MGLFYSNGAFHLGYWNLSLVYSWVKHYLSFTFLMLLMVFCLLVSEPPKEGEFCRLMFGSCKSAFRNYFEWAYPPVSPLNAFVAVFDIWDNLDVAPVRLSWLTLSSYFSSFSMTRSSDILISLPVSQMLLGMKAFCLGLLALTGVVIVPGICLVLCGHEPISYKLLMATLPVMLRCFSWSLLCFVRNCFLESVFPPMYGRPLVTFSFLLL